MTPAIPNGARVYVCTHLVPGGKLATVEARVGVAPDGCDVYRVRYDGEPLSVLIADCFLSDLTGHPPRPRASFAPAPGAA